MRNGKLLAKTRTRMALGWVVLLMILLGNLVGMDWPQWRGENRDGQSADQGLLQEWPAEGPPLLFRAQGLGSGYSSLSLQGSRIYTMGDLEGTQYVLALDRADGRLIWKAPVGPAWDHEYPGPRSTPTADGQRVYALSTEGILVCLESTQGNEIWRRSLPQDFGGLLMSYQGTYSWKFSESPLVDGERVLVSPGNRNAALVALDKRSGEQIWRAAIPDLGEKGSEGAGYSSIVISEGGGIRQYVQLVGRGAVGVEAETGRFLWGYNRITNGTAVITTPLVSGDYVMVSSGYATGTALLKLVPSDQGVQAEEVYFLPPETMQNHHGGLILHDGFVYSGTGHNKGFPLAVELMTGRVAWGPVRNAGKGSAAVSFADGHLYFRYQDGLMVLVEANPEEYREKGSFMIPGVKQFSWSHPVITDGRLYLREQGNLFCYDVRDHR